MRVSHSTLGFRALRCLLHVLFSRFIHALVLKCEGVEGKVLSRKCRLECVVNPVDKNILPAMAPLTRVQSFPPSQKWDSDWLHEKPVNSDFIPASSSAPAQAHQLRAAFCDLLSFSEIYGGYKTAPVADTVPVAPVPVGPTIPVPIPVPVGPTFVVL